MLLKMKSQWQGVVQGRGAVEGVKSIRDQGAYRMGGNLVSCSQGVIAWGFEGEMSPTGSCIWAFGPQLVGEAMKPLGGIAWLEEACLWWESG